MEKYVKIWILIVSICLLQNSVVSTLRIHVELKNLKNQIAQQEQTITTIDATSSKASSFVGECIIAAKGNKAFDAVLVKYNIPSTLVAPQQQQQQTIAK